jgi:peptide-methionine (S)-S-oxide reductase
MDRQGNDAGTQYRSVIFTHSEQQRQTAQQLIAELDGDALSGRKIVTQVRPATKFYEAEAYHQEYFKNNPGQGYCSFVVAPKLKKFREKFAEKRRKGA